MPTRSTRVSTFPVAFNTSEREARRRATQALLSTFPSEVDKIRAERLRQEAEAEAEATLKEVEELIKSKEITLESYIQLEEKKLASLKMRLKMLEQKRAGGDPAQAPTQDQTTD